MYHSLALLWWTKNSWIWYLIWRLVSRFAQRISTNPWFYLRSCFLWNAFLCHAFCVIHLSIFHLLWKVDDRWSVMTGDQPWQVTGHDRWPVMTGDQSWQVTSHDRWRATLSLSCYPAFIFKKKSVNMLIFSK